MFEVKGKYSTAKVFAEIVDNETVSQITKMVNHPAFELPDGKHIAIMPDTHAGKGSVIGFTMPLQGKVVSNVVGVDIGCGMLGLKIRPGKDGMRNIRNNLEKIDREIREQVPMGFNVREDDCFAICDDLHSLNYEMLRGKIFVLSKKMGFKIDSHQLYRFSWYKEMCERIGMKFGRAQASIGSLGGGNHFIELGEVDGEDAIWLVIHTGSRQIGEKVCRYWQGIANKIQNDKKGAQYEAQIRRIRETSNRVDIPRLIKEFRESEGVVSGPSDLDFLDGEDMLGYLTDMVFAQEYARLNRHAIASVCSSVLSDFMMDPVDGSAFRMPVTEIETVHNYIDFDDLVMRKGAVRAHEHEKFILPFNMRDGTLICRAKGNEEWNCSAPHGAGRIMSRRQAKRDLDAHLAAEQMEGIYTSVIPIDEAPGAYKDAQLIEDAIGDTADIVERIRPILNIKAG